MLKQVQHDMKRAAFTLAEVLITLGIIGAIAALTMPTLIQKKNASETQSKVKKAYATLTNAWSLAQADGFDMSNIYYVNEGIANHINYTRKCDEEKCFADSYKFLLAKDSSNGSYFYSDYTYLLSDGTAIAFKYGENQYQTLELSYSGVGYVYVDINGLKEPNTWAKDLFLFEVNKTGIVPLPMDRCDYNGIYCSGQAIYGNMSYLDEITSEGYTCETTSGGHSLTCEKK